MSYRYIECVEDTFHDLLLPVNLWLQAHSLQKNLMVTLLAVMSDVLFFRMMHDWLSQKSWRLAIALGILIATKEVCSVSHKCS